MDAYVLSQIPIEIFKSIQSAVVEVWALPEINPADVDKFINAISFSIVLAGQRNLLENFHPKLSVSFGFLSQVLQKIYL